MKFEINYIFIKSFLLNSIRKSILQNWQSLHMLLTVHVLKMKSFNKKCYFFRY